MSASRADWMVARPISTDPRVERSRAAALDAARDLLKEEGWDAITQMRVADRAGIGRATVYRHWPQTAALLRDALVGLLPQFEVQSTRDLHADLVDLLRRVGSELTGGFGRVVVALIDRAESDPQVDAIKAEVERITASLIARRLRAAGLITSASDSGAAVDQLLGPVLYRTLMTNRRVTTAFLDQVVAEFLSARAST